MFTYLFLLKNKFILFYLHLDSVRCILQMNRSKAFVHDLKNE